jgi:trigger factor
MAEEQEKPQEQLPITSKNTVTVEEAGPCKKKVTIEIPAESIKEATDGQYETLRKEAILPGFRKGRAPRRLLEKRFGKETTEQIKLELIAKSSEAALKDNKIDVLGDPNIEFEKIELPAEGPMKFDFEVEVRPKFEMPALEGIPLNKTKFEITDEQINKEIEQLQKWSGVWAPREGGEVESGDQIIADATLKVEGAEEEESLDNIEVFVRPSGFVGAIPVEKLDELLIGAKPGDTKETSVEVSKTYFKEQYRGKKVEIKISVKDIKFLKPAEMNEDFFKRFGAADEKELRERIREMLQGRLEQQAKNEMTEQVYKYMSENIKFDLPLNIVADQAESLLHRQYSNLLSRGLSREQIEEQMDKLRASSEEQAKEQLKTFFIMDEVAEKLGIEVTDEEINGHIAQLALQRGTRPERLREEMVRNGSLANFKLQVREDKSIAKLLETAKITEVEAPKETEKKPAKKASKKAEKAESKEESAEEKPKKKKTASKKKTDE